MTKRTKKAHLSLDEKRRWLAAVFRDESGEFSQADKFKALAEDTKLAVLQQEAEREQAPAEAVVAPELPLLQSLPPPALPTAGENGSPV